MTHLALRYTIFTFVIFRFTNTRFVRLLKQFSRGGDTNLHDHTFTWSRKSHCSQLYHVPQGPISGSTLDKALAFPTDKDGTVFGQHRLVFLSDKILRMPSFLTEEWSSQYDGISHLRGNRPYGLCCRNLMRTRFYRRRTQRFVSHYTCGTVSV